MSEILEPFDSGLKTGNITILFNIYRHERISYQNRIRYENFLKNNYPKEYDNFLEFKIKVKNKTPNIKELIFQWLDGKRDIPDLELFLERFRVIKDVINGNIFTDINSLDLIDQADALALVVLQFNTNKLLKLDSDTLISDVIKEYDIDFDISFSTDPVSKAEVKEILDNEKSTTISDITDGFDILREKISHMELCNGSALIVDMDLGVVAYTITSAGKFFPKVFETVETLKSRGIEIYIASGDRKGAINRLANMLDVPEDNAFGTVSTRGKCEVVSILKDSGYKVMMVGDGLNDILAFKKADVSVLTIEQQEEVSPKMMDKTDYVIEDIFEVTLIDF